MKKLLLAIVCFLAPVASAYAQVPVAVARAACGAQSLTAGRYFPLAVDLTGNLCTSGSGGGGGGAVTVADGADVTQGAKADAAYAGSGAATVVSILKGLYAGVTGSVPAGTALIGNTGNVYPAGSTPITASATGTTAATTATLAANGSLHTYVCGFSIRANATAAATNNATVTGTVTGTLNFTQWTAPLASGLGINEQVFIPCVISSAINTGIAVISGAPGSGGVVSVSAWGYQL